MGGIMWNLHSLQQPEGLWKHQVLGRVTSGGPSWSIISWKFWENFTQSPQKMHPPSWKERTWSYQKHCWKVLFLFFSWCQRSETSSNKKPNQQSGWGSCSKDPKRIPLMFIQRFQRIRVLVASHIRPPHKLEAFRSFANSASNRAGNGAKAWRLSCALSIPPKYLLSQCRCASFT